MTAEERRKLVEAPLPTVHVYGHKSWSGIGVCDVDAVTRYRVYTPDLQPGLEGGRSWVIRENLSGND